MPYLYDSPEARKAGLVPDPAQPNIITSVNLKEPKRPGDILKPLPNMRPVDWQKYMDDWWRDNKNDPKAKEKVDQIRQAAADAKMPISEGKRIPRKKGQKAKSKKHSDLYTTKIPKEQYTD